MSNLQTYYHFKLDFQKVDQHIGGKWLICNGVFWCLPVSIASRLKMTLNVETYLFNLKSILILGYCFAASVVLNSKRVRNMGCFSVFHFANIQNIHFEVDFNPILKVFIASTFRCFFFSIEYQTFWVDWWSCNNSLYIWSGVSGCNPDRGHQNVLNISLCRISNDHIHHILLASAYVCFSFRGFYLWTP